MAKEYNEQIKEEELEEREEIKDLIESTQHKLEDVIKAETNELKANLVNSKQRREEELNHLHSQYENEMRKREDEKHYSTQLIAQNNEKLDRTTSFIMQNFEKQIKQMFNEVSANLQKDEDEERQRSEAIRQRELELIEKIDKKNESINRLKYNQDDLENKLMRQSQQDLASTFERMEESKYKAESGPASKKALRKIEEKQKKEKEQTLMESEDLRMRQIMLEEKRVRELKELERKLRADVEASKLVRVSQEEIKAIEDRIMMKVETDKWQEIEQLEKKQRVKEEELKKQIREKNKNDDSEYK